MNKASIAKQNKTANVLSPTQGMFQRQCACENKTVAGGECTQCAKKKSGLQRKLAIGASNDPLEREADRVADQVMAIPSRSTASYSQPRIQRYVGRAIEGSDTTPASVDKVLASSGRPLEPVLRQDMEQRFGHDFSQVRVHSGGAAEQSARDVNANAYTVGHNIVFGVGQFVPRTNVGQRLIAHELTHVLQQSGAKPTWIKKISAADRQQSASVVQRQSRQIVKSQSKPTGIRLAESLPFGHANLKSDKLKSKFRTYVGAVTRLQVTPAGNYRGHCAKEYLTEVANTCPARFVQLRSGGFCTASKCLDFGRWGKSGDGSTGTMVTDTKDSFIDRHRTRHPKSLLEGTGRNSCSVVCHQKFKYDRKSDLGSFFIIRNFRASKYTPPGSTKSLHITTGEVKKVPASLTTPTKAAFAKKIAPGLVKSGVLGDAPSSSQKSRK